MAAIALKAKLPDLARPGHPLEGHRHHRRRRGLHRRADRLPARVPQGRPEEVLRGRPADVEAGPAVHLGPAAVLPLHVRRRAWSHASTALPKPNGLLLRRRHGVRRPVLRPDDPRPRLRRAPPAAARRSTTRSPTTSRTRSSSASSRATPTRSASRSLDDTVARGARRTSAASPAWRSQSGRDRDGRPVRRLPPASRPLLLGKALGEPFVSFKRSLFCDRAVVGGWDRGRDEPIKPYTTCETMDAGWCWQIEHENRINRGYVYSSDFISDEEAEREFRAKNPKVGPTRIVRFVSGRYQRGWVKNVVAIGNASGFVEPLEATAPGRDRDAEPTAGRRRWSTPTASRARRRCAAYNHYHAPNWDGIRGFLASTTGSTPGWTRRSGGTAARRPTWPAPRPIVEYYRENGPDGLLGTDAAHAGRDQFGISGYVALLAGRRCRTRPGTGPADSNGRRGTVRPQKRSTRTSRQGDDGQRGPRGDPFTEMEVGPAFTRRGLNEPAVRIVERY